MKNSKFMVLIRTLRKDERANFSRYLKRLHHLDHAPLAIYDYVLKFAPDFSDEKKLEIGYAYKQIFKASLEENKSNRVKILNALSDLHLWLKEFLLLEKVRGNSFESQSFWMAILKERGLTAEFSRKATLLQREVEGMHKSSISDYMKGMFSNYLFYYHLTQDKHRENMVAIQDCSKYLDLFYSIARLKIACEVANRQRLISEEAGTESLPAILELSKTGLVSDHPLLALYLLVYELISSQNPVHYLKIESMLKENVDRIAPEEMQAILGYLHNFLAFQLRRGKDNFSTIMHSINKFAIEHQVVSGGGEISPAYFSNIVNVACGARDVAWAEDFIKNYEFLLPPDARNDSVRLARAIVSFEKKDFGEVLFLLRDVSYFDLLYAIRAKSLVLRSMYELAGENKSAVVDYCLAFEAYLKRHRNPKREAVEATLNFVGITKKLAIGKTPMAAILELIQHTNPLYHRSWLIQNA